MPIIARFDFADGYNTVNIPADVWFEGHRSRTFSWPLRGKTLKSITLDPEYRFQDLDRANNVWNAK